MLVGALSFDGPEAGALTVMASLPGVGAVTDGAGGPAVVAGFTVSFTAACLADMPAGTGVTVTLPGCLTAESVVFEVLPVETGVLPPFEVGTATMGAVLPAATVVGALTTEF